MYIELQKCRNAEMQHNLIPVTPEIIAVRTPLDITGFTSEQGTVNLTELADVIGVGVLAEGEALQFINSAL